jgi:hypothetical protein
MTFSELPPIGLCKYFTKMRCSIGEVTEHFSKLSRFFSEHVHLMERISPVYAADLKNPEIVPKLQQPGKIFNRRPVFYRMTGF